MFLTRHDIPMMIKTSHYQLFVPHTINIRRGFLFCQTAIYYATNSKVQTLYALFLHHSQTWQICTVFRIGNDNMSYIPVQLNQFFIRTQNCFALHRFNTHFNGFKDFKIFAVIYWYEIHSFDLIVIA
jgi:hypothetical protein